MQIPSITATYLAVLALIYVVLGLQVVRLRRRHKAGFGDGGNEQLRCAIRAHGHFAEYVPLITLMVALLEMSGLPAAHVHRLMGILLAARILHPFGMYAKPGSLQFTIGRIGGMVLTITVTVVAALLILQRTLIAA
jgi:uncharacterized membrane protein YecN with MAPEG domain